MPYRFLVKIRPNEYQQAPRLRVSFREKHRVKKIIGNLPGFGPIREIEHDGWDRTMLTIRAGTVGDYTDRATYQPVLKANGTSAQANNGGTVDRTGQAVHTVARRLSDQDAQILGDIDGEMAALERQLVALRRRRKEAVASAWRRGRQILVHEVTPEDGERVRLIPAE